MNQVILIGRLTRDPEVRYTQSGKAWVSCSIAVDRRKSKDGTKGVDFIPIVAWDKLAEIMGNNLAKGRRIGIEGRLQTRTYEAQDGTKRSAFEVVINEMEFLDSKNSGNAPAHGPHQDAPEQGSFGPPLPDEEIPF